MKLRMLVSDVIRCILCSTASAGRAHGLTPVFSKLQYRQLSRSSTEAHDTCEGGGHVETEAAHNALQMLVFPFGLSHDIQPLAACVLQAGCTGVPEVCGRKPVRQPAKCRTQRIWCLAAAGEQLCFHKATA